MILRETAEHVSWSTVAAEINYSWPQSLGRELLSDLYNFLVSVRNDHPGDLSLLSFGLFFTFLFIMLTTDALRTCLLPSLVETLWIYHLTSFTQHELPPEVENNLLVLLQFLLLLKFTCKHASSGSAGPFSDTESLQHTGCTLDIFLMHITMASLEISGHCFLQMKVKL